MAEIDHTEAENAAGAQEEEHVHDGKSEIGSKKEKRMRRLMSRVTELDALRGVAVLLMILDHIAFDFWGLLPMAFRDFPASGGLSSQIVNVAKMYWTWDVRTVVRYVVLFVFLGLTGVCCSFSKSNLKRGGKLMIAAMVLTAGTFAVGRMVGDPDILITFGVLHCIALALLIIGALEKVTSNKWVYLSIGVVLTGVGIWLRVRGAPFASYASAPFPELLGKGILGLVEIGSDCFAFPLHGGQIFIGVFLGKVLFADKKPVYRKPTPYRNNFLTFVGRNSLWIYLIHQFMLPVIIGTILLICGFHLNI